MTIKVFFVSVKLNFENGVKRKYRYIQGDLFISEHVKISNSNPIHYFKNQKDIQ